MGKSPESVMYYIEKLEKEWIETLDDLNEISDQELSGGNLCFPRGLVLLLFTCFMNNSYSYIILTLSTCILHYSAVRALNVSKRLSDWHHSFLISEFKNKKNKINRY